MSALDVPQIALLGVLMALLGWCAIEDVRARNIAHWTILSIAALYVVYAAAGYGEWRPALIGGGIFLVLGFVLFHLKLMGGGDSKLIAALGLWTGLSQMGPFLFYTAVAGGVVALAVLVQQRLRAHGGDTAAEAPTVPYGVAIAFGGTVAAWQSALAEAI